MRKGKRFTDLVISTSDSKQVLGHCAFIAAASIYILFLMSDPEFFNILAINSKHKRNVTASNRADNQYNHQPNIAILEEDILEAADIVDSDIKPASQTQLSTVQKAELSESAAVMEAIIDWVYEDKISEDSKLYADIYKAASKYHFKDLCAYIASQIDQLKDNAKFIVSMTRIAFEQNDESLIRKLAPIFKANPSLRQTSEYKTQLNEYGLQLLEYIMKC